MHAALAGQQDVEFRYVGCLPHNHLPSLDGAKTRARAELWEEWRACLALKVRHARQPRAELMRHPLWTRTGRRLAQDCCNVLAKGRLRPAPAKAGVEPAQRLGGSPFGSDCGRLACCTLLGRRWIPKEGVLACAALNLGLHLEPRLRDAQLWHEHGARGVRRWRCRGGDLGRMSGAFRQRRSGPCGWARYPQCHLAHRALCWLTRMRDRIGCALGSAAASRRTWGSCWAWSRQLLRLVRLVRRAGQRRRD